MQGDGCTATWARRSRPKDWAKWQISGFTRTDLLATVAMVAVIAALIVVPVTTVRAKNRLALCSNNLNEVGKAILRFSEDHDATLPGLRPAAAGSPWWFYKEEIRTYVDAAETSGNIDPIFACPMDRGYTDALPFRANPRFDFTSYVFNGVTLPGCPNIAGWRLPNVRQTDRTLLVMEWTAHGPLSWHRSKTGKANAPFYRDAESVVTFTDGHTELIKVYYDGYNAAFTRDPIPGYRYKYSGL